VSWTSFGFCPLVFMSQVLFVVVVGVLGLCGFLSWVLPALFGSLVVVLFAVHWNLSGNVGPGIVEFLSLC
jgi:hypothetical protein